MSKPAKPHVTTRDIAKATGLHQTTVSLGLRNSPRLRPETLEIIKKTAELLGYSPDPMLSTLNVHKQSKRSPQYKATIAWINNWPDREALLKDSTYRQYYGGVCDRCHQLGYTVEEFWMHSNGMGPDRMVEILKARNIQGLVIAPQLHPRTTFSLDYSNFSVVVFGYSIQPPLLHVVSNHHSHSVEALLSKLLKLGYRRIGMIVGDIWDGKVENAWLGGIKLAYWNNPEMIVIPPLGESRNKRDLVQWLRKFKPDVVVSSDGVVKELEALGYSVPGDIGFASLNKEDSDDSVISGLNQNSFYIGQKAVDVLVGLLQRNEKGIPAIPIRWLVESIWEDGKTLRQQTPDTRLPKKRMSVIQR